MIFADTVTLVTRGNKVSHQVSLTGPVFVIEMIELDIYG